jgi:hypothetical protein
VQDERDALCWSQPLEHDHKGLPYFVVQGDPVGRITERLMIYAERAVEPTGLRGVLYARAFRSNLVQAQAAGHDS